MSTVQLSIEGQVARIYIDRADKHNALTQSMWQQISDYCDQLTNTSHPKVLIISAAGEKAFCAGADISELTEIIQDESRLVANNKVVQQAQLKLQQLPFPTIAAINGACIGGGMGIALCCDFRIAVEHAKFGITPSKLGLLYSIEDTKRVTDLLGVARAKELLYLGKIITASQANDWGLLTSLVATSELDNVVNELVQQVLSVSSFSTAGVKKTIEYVTGTVAHDETDVRSMFNQAFANQDFIEGANAFLAKRPAKFK